MSQVKTKRTNPAKVILQDQGISFPNPNNQGTFTSQSSSLYRCAPSNRQEETEQLNMVLKHSLLESNCSAQQEQQSLFTPAANVMMPIYFNPLPYHVNNSAPAYTFPNDYYGNVDPYYNPPDIYPYTPTVQQPAVFHQSDVSFPVNSFKTIAAPNTISPLDDMTKSQTTAETRNAALQLMFLSKGNDECPK